MLQFKGDVNKIKIKQEKITGTNSANSYFLAKSPIIHKLLTRL